MKNFKNKKCIQFILENEYLFVIKNEKKYTNTKKLKSWKQINCKAVNKIIKKKFVCKLSLKK